MDAVMMGDGWSMELSEIIILISPLLFPAKK